MRAGHCYRHRKAGHYYGQRKARRRQYGRLFEFQGVGIGRQERHHGWCRASLQNYENYDVIGMSDVSDVNNVNNVRAKKPNTMHHCKEHQLICMVIIRVRHCHFALLH